MVVFGGAVILAAAVLFLGSRGREEAPLFHKHVFLGYAPTINNDFRNTWILHDNAVNVIMLIPIYSEEGRSASMYPTRTGGISVNLGDGRSWEIEKLRDTAIIAHRSGTITRYKVPPGFTESAIKCMGLDENPYSSPADSLQALISVLNP